MSDIARTTAGSNPKRAYRMPTLTVYGSVRELTGAGSGSMSDATNMMKT